MQVLDNLTFINLLVIECEESLNILGGSDLIN
jgi:hypothetical protein